MLRCVITERREKRREKEGKRFVTLILIFKGG